MKLQVLQENLVKALNLTARFASSKAQLPVLGNILLSADKNRLLVASTNLEISVATWVGAKVEKGGNLTIPAKTVTELVINLPPGTVNLESEKEQLKISSPNFTSTLSGMNSSDFPEIPQTLDKTNGFSLPREGFIQSVSQSIFAASIDEARPTLTGILFLFGKENLTLVATDGFRLSQKKMQLGSANKSFKGEKLILPKTALGELSRLSEEEDTIAFSFKEKENQAIFGVGETVLSTRVLDGEFPDFEKIIPKSSVYKATLDKEEFLRGVKLASVFARESANIVKLKVSRDSLEVSAESSQSGNQKTKVDAKTEGSLPADGFEIAFNYRFLEEFLHSVAGEDVRLEFSDEGSPGVFLDTKDESYLHLIMPVKIQA